MTISNPKNIDDFDTWVICTSLELILKTPVAVIDFNNKYFYVSDNNQIITEVDNTFELIFSEWYLINLFGNQTKYPENLPAWVLQKHEMSKYNNPVDFIFNQLVIHGLI